MAVGMQTTFADECNRTSLHCVSLSFLSSGAQVDDSMIDMKKDDR